MEKILISLLSAVHVLQVATDPELAPTVATVHNLAGIRLEVKTHHSGKIECNLFDTSHNRKLASKTVESLGWHALTQTYRLSKSVYVVWTYTETQQFPWGVAIAVDVNKKALLVTPALKNPSWGQSGNAFTEHMAAFQADMPKVKGAIPSRMAKLKRVWSVQLSPFKIAPGAWEFDR